MDELLLCFDFSPEHVDIKYPGSSWQNVHKINKLLPLESNPVVFLLSFLGSFGLFSGEYFLKSL